MAKLSFIEKRQLDRYLQKRAPKLVSRWERVKGTGCERSVGDWHATLVRGVSTSIAKCLTIERTVTATTCPPGGSPPALVGDAPLSRYDEGEGDAMDATPTTVQIQLQVPTNLGNLAFPEALDRRLHTLLDKQDQGERLTEDEQVEAEALVELAQLLTLLRLRMSPEVPATTAVGA